MKTSWSGLSVLLKGLVICVVVLLVASGLCGLQLTLIDHARDTETGILIITGIIELAAIFLASTGIVIILLILLGSWLQRQFAAKDTTQNAVEKNDQNRDPRQ